MTSEETRHHLQDAHQRVMSVAEIQRHLHPTLNADEIEVDSYLSKLCASLALSMVAENQQISVKVMANKGSVRSDKAVSIGLIVTELVINAIKYAFPADRPAPQILVTYQIDDQDWKLVVSDNGIGKGDANAVEATGGLGTAIIEASCVSSMREWTSQATLAAPRYRSPGPPSHLACRMQPEQSWSRLEWRRPDVLCSARKPGSSHRIAGLPRHRKRADRSMRSIMWAAACRVKPGLGEM